MADQNLSVGPTMTGGPQFNPDNIGLVAPKNVGIVDPIKLGSKTGITVPGGSSTTDTITKSEKKEHIFQDAIEQISQADPGFTGAILGLTLKSLENTAQKQLDNLDPTNPAVPLLAKFVEMSQQHLLASGDVVAALGNQGATILEQHHNFVQGKDSSGNIQKNADGTDAPVTGPYVQGTKGQGNQGEGGSQGGSGGQGQQGQSQASIFDEVVQTSEGAEVSTSSGPEASTTQGQNQASGPTQTNATTQTSALDTANVPGEGTSDVGGDRWLAGNAYTAFLITYMAMAMALIQMKETESQIQIAAINIIMSLAQDTASAIMNAAQQRFWEHIAMAIVDGVGIGITAASAVGSIVATSRMQAEKDTEMKNPDGSSVLDDAGNPKLLQSKEDAKLINKQLEGGLLGTMMFQSIGQAGQSATKMVDNIIQGTMELKASQYDAQKEMLQAYRQVEQNMLENVTNNFKANTDLIDQIYKSLVQLRQQISDYINKSLSRG